MIQKLIQLRDNLQNLAFLRVNVQAINKMVILFLNNFTKQSKQKNLVTPILWELQKDLLI